MSETNVVFSPVLRAQLGVLDVDSVAELLGCSPEKVKEQAAAGELPHIRLGRSPVFPVLALLDYLNARAKDGVQTPAPAPASLPQPLGVLKRVEPRGRRAPPPALPDLS